jgi:hypothetical protein
MYCYLFTLRNVQKTVLFDFFREFSDEGNVLAHCSGHLLELRIVGDEILDVADTLNVLKIIRTKEKNVYSKTSFLLLLIQNFRFQIGIFARNSSFLNGN